MMQTNHWTYLHGEPSVSGRLKVQPQDFRVTEKLGYEPSGVGEHIYLWVRKTGLNTAYVAEQLAKFARVSAHAVTYAGRKDKYAVTEQWFSVHKPGKAEFDWAALELVGVTVLKAIRHDKKLRTGVLKGNRFDLLVRDLSATAELEDRLTQIQRHGVPNYFGAQRFGDSRYDSRGGNLVLAEKMLAGEDIRNRNKRSMAISALRSWLFNECVSRRLADGYFSAAMPGDIMLLSGSGSFFCAEEIDELITQRLQSQDIQLSAPLWGQGPLATKGPALQYETAQSRHYPQQTACLEKLGLKQERRAIRLQPANMSWQLDEQSLSISFDLPAGAFATSVLREAVNLHQDFLVD